MKKTLLLLPVLATLVACGTTDPYEKRAIADREHQERLVDRAIDKAPKWMTELPKSKSAIYQNGTSVSPDMGMSATKAKTMAYAKICMSAGGQVNQQTRMFRIDSTSSSVETSEMAVKTFCPNVDISGVETVETRVVSEGTQFRTYVLVALPTGDANAIQKFKAEQTLRKLAETRGQDAFKEMGNQSKASQ